MGNNWVRSTWDMGTPGVAFRLSTRLQMTLLNGGFQPAVDLSEGVAADDPDKAEAGVLGFLYHYWPDLKSPSVVGIESRGGTSWWFYVIDPSLPRKGNHDEWPEYELVADELRSGTVTPTLPDSPIIMKGGRI